MGRLTLLFAVACALGGAIAACGSSQESLDSPSQAPGAKQAKLDRELHRLQRKLNHKRAMLRAERKRKAHSSPSTAASKPFKFAVLEAQLDGQVGVSIGPPGSDRVFTAGKLVSGPAWSTIKVPIALRVLQDAGGPSGLNPAQADDIQRALTLSDNDAAAALFGGLERAHGGMGGAATAVEAILRQAGDSATQISTRGRAGFSPYGQTEWSLAVQQRFMSQLVAGCVGTQASRDYVLNLMGQVTSDQWGLGSAGLAAKWKGGWGPGPDGRYLVRQMGTLHIGDREAVVTLAAIPADGSFTTSQRLATSVAQWLGTQAMHAAATPVGC